jgi:hypothetical protein
MGLELLPKKKIFSPLINFQNCTALRKFDFPLNSCLDEERFNIETGEVSGYTKILVKFGTLGLAIVLPAVIFFS